MQVNNLMAKDWIAFCRNYCRFKGPWKAIANCCQKDDHLYKVVTEKADKILFCKNHWLGDGPICSSYWRLYILVDSKGATIDHG